MGVKRRENKPPQSEKRSPAKHPRDQRPGPKRRRRGRHDHDKTSVPAVLPVVVAAAHGEDLLVTVDGVKDTAETVARDELAAVLARLVADLGVPTRVEVHDTDGRILADILQPPQPAQSETSEDQSAQETTEVDEDGLIEISGDEFAPGEAVAIAVILRHTTAESTGLARTLVDPTLLPGAGGADVVMIGRDSQTVAVRPLT